jgi:hypothetical protein
MKGSGTPVVKLRSRLVNAHPSEDQQAVGIQAKVICSILRKLRSSKPHQCRCVQPICTPGNGSTVSSPVNIIAGTTDATPVKLTQVYLDGKKIYETPLSAIAVRLPISKGPHRLTVQALDTNNVFFKGTLFVTVSSD